MLKKCMTAHDLKSLLERAKRRMTDLKGKSFSYLCINSTGGI